MSSVTSDLDRVARGSRPGPIARLKQFARVVRVLTGMDLKIRYADSALGYVWTIGKPLILFSILYVVFGKLVRFGTPTPHFALYLLIGVMLWSFFADGVTRTMNSIVGNGVLIRKLPFPRLIIPLAASLTSLITFGLSIVAMAAFVVGNQLVPKPSWLLLIPELIELYLLVAGLGLILAILYVRLRDITQIWDLALQLLFFLSPIVYPFTIVPPHGRQLMLLNPFTQIMQDVRAIILTPELAIAAPAAATPLRVLPLAGTGIVVVVALLLFKLESPKLAERV